MCSPIHMQIHHRVCISTSSLLYYHVDQMATSGANIPCALILCLAPLQLQLCHTALWHPHVRVLARTLLKITRSSSPSTAPKCKTPGYPDHTTSSLCCPIQMEAAQTRAWEELARRRAAVHCIHLAGVLMQFLHTVGWASTSTTQMLATTLACCHKVISWIEILLRRPAEKAGLPWPQCANMFHHASCCSASAASATGTPSKPYPTAIATSATSATAESATSTSTPRATAQSATATS